MATIHSLGPKMVITAGSRIFLHDDEKSSCRVIEPAIFATTLPVIRKPRSTSGEREDDDKEGPGSTETHTILCSSMSHEQKYFAIGLASKIVLIFKTENFEVARGFRIPKAPTSMTFDKVDEFVIIGDRAGHVCRYKVREPINVNHKDITGEICHHEGEPLTGVISMVLDVAVSTDGKYVLFADRDEKIRISRYPQAYVTEAYCLGHSEYVSSIKVVDDAVFSSGGDSVLIRWNLHNGAFTRRSSIQVTNQNPVRKVVCSKKDDGTVFIYVIAENEPNVYIYEDDGYQMLERGSAYLTDVAIDICPYKDYIFAVTRSGVLQVEMNDINMRQIKITEDLKNELIKSKDPISSYFKKVTHKNLEDYQKRKAQRIESEKEKKKKKKESKVAETADN